MTACPGHVPAHHCITAFVTAGPGPRHHSGPGPRHRSSLPAADTGTAQHAEAETEDPDRTRGEPQTPGLRGGAEHPVGSNDGLLSVPCPSSQLFLQPMGRAQPVTFLLFVLQNTLQKAERGEPGAFPGLTFTLTLVSSLPPCFFPGALSQRPADLAREKPMSSSLGLEQERGPEPITLQFCLSPGPAPSPDKILHGFVPMVRAARGRNGAITITSWNFLESDTAHTPNSRSHKQRSSRIVLQLASVCWG